MYGSELRAEFNAAPTFLRTNERSNERSNESRFSAALLFKGSVRGSALRLNK